MCFMGCKIGNGNVESTERKVFKFSIRRDGNFRQF